MKLKSITLIAIGFIIALLVGAAPQPTPTVGRFALYSHDDKLFRIDTSTGRAWLFASLYPTNTFAQHSASIDGWGSFLIEDATRSALEFNLATNRQLFLKWSSTQTYEMP